MTVMILQPLPADVRDQYLAYLGVTRESRRIAPTLATLVDLQHAHLDRVVYTTLDIYLNRASTLDPQESVQRILDDRGGYCFHLNGAFAALLLSIGYDVVLARSAVPAARDDGRGWGNHVSPLVRLGTDTYVIEAGIGDGIRDPLRLVEDEVVQPPFRYRLEHRGGALWRLHHDERASIAGLDLDTTPVELSSFVARHALLSTAQDSYFVRNLVARRRYSDHTLALRGCVLTWTDSRRSDSRDVLNEHEWLTLIETDFGLNLSDLNTREKRCLWQRVRATHDAWDAAGRP